MSIPRECKRLVEVDFPIAAVGVRSAEEKASPPGHPATLHLWWARRPLAACRAILLGLLLPDPADPLCPKEFKNQARRALAGIEGDGPKTDLELRRALLDFISEFADWSHAGEEPYVARARALVNASHQQETSIVVDSFAGGGSIPLEALRIGCETFASDLNPVACLILKVMLDEIPKGGPILADRLREAGLEIQVHAQAALTDFYPPDPDGARPIVYLWARTVRCESPKCGCEIPLSRSFSLSKKTERKRALRWRVERTTGRPPEVSFEIFEPKQEEEIPPGTVRQAKAFCPACGTVLAPERVRAQLASGRGGADVVLDGNGRRVGGARLLAVVTIKDGQVGRRYRLPTQRDYEAVFKSTRRLEKVMKVRSSSGLTSVPDEPLPSPPGRTRETAGAYYNFVPLGLYGFQNWGDLFTTRQKVALVTLKDLVAEKCRTEVALSDLLALAFDRVAMSETSLTRWNAFGEKMQHTFGRQALPIVWDFAEVVPIAEAPGNWKSGYELVAEVVDYWPSGSTNAQIQMLDARNLSLPDETASVWFTDPPYYDAVPYADLSDFFFVWLKRLLPNHPLLRDRLDSSNPLTPKSQEIIDSLELVRGVPKEDAMRLGLGLKDKSFYEEGMYEAFSEGRRLLKEDGVGCVVFAHKTTEGWEALLSGMVRGGWTITASWPITTEMGSRLRARDSAVLSASVHLVCRPRPTDAPVGEWEQILRELPRRISDWIEVLSKEGIRGADLVFSCIGPATELYSRYPRVEAADGREVRLQEFLAKVWQVLGQAALERILGGPGKTEEATGSFEEDARLTALFLWTLQSTAINEKGGALAGARNADQELGDEDEEVTEEREKGGYTLPFDIVRRFAQPLGIHLEDWSGRVIETKKGVVRLLPISAQSARLFGGETAETVAAGAAQLRRAHVQAKLYADLELASSTTEEVRHQKQPMKTATKREMTTLDRVHTAMLLQTTGQSGALREFLESEIRRGPQFLRLANALSALYPKKSEEKRLLDAVLLTVPRK